MSRRSTNAVDAATEALLVATSGTGTGGAVRIPGKRPSVLWAETGYGPGAAAVIGPS